MGQSTKILLSVMEMGGAASMLASIDAWEGQNPLPEISRFFGVIIRMYAEPGLPHHQPHFHAYYQNDAAIYGIDPVELLAGCLPRRQQRLVEAWAELHQEELLANWRRLQSGEPPQKIPPLA